MIPNTDVRRTSKNGALWPHELLSRQRTAQPLGCETGNHLYNVQRDSLTSYAYLSFERQMSISEIGRDYEPRHTVEDYDPWVIGHTVLANAVRTFHTAMDEMLGPEAARGNSKALLSLDSGFREFAADARYRQHIDEAVSETDKR